MKNRYAIYAYENFYGGSHGFFDVDIVYADTDDEALAIAEDMSYTIIENYSTIYDELVSEVVEDYDGENMTADEEIAVEDAITEDIAYRVGKIIRDDLTNDQCNSLLYDDPDGFIDNYCEGIGE